MRICNYRNCKKDISNMRRDAKYCERKYKSNEKKRLEKNGLI